MKQNHPFHIVFISPWPLIIATRIFSMLLGTAYWTSSKSPYLIRLGIIITILTVTQWWRDVSRERSLQGYHTNLVINGLRWGIILFIVSEILFFFRFFWAFFHRRLSPNMELGGTWPPIGIIAIAPFQVPLLNTAILLSSGITVTWAHHSLVKINNYQTNSAIWITIILGIYFTILQGWEYLESSFSIRDSAYGSVFFIATGFHGIHVIVGTLFLIFSFIRHKINIFSFNHHSGIEIAIWYWHFVDVVWLFLFRFIYWWAFYNINIR